MSVKFTLSIMAYKKMMLGFELLIDKNIFAVNSVNDSYCKYIFCYLQLSEDSS